MNGLLIKYTNWDLSTNFPRGLNFAYKRNTLTYDLTYTISEGVRAKVKIKQTF